MKEKLKELLKKKDDPDYIVSCLNLLTPLEKSILLILHTEECALNIKQIQNHIIINLVNFIQRWKQSRSVLGDEMDRVFDYKVKLLPYFNFTPEDIRALDNHLFNLEVDGKKTNQLDTSQEGINYYKKSLNQMNINYPSYEKIRSDIAELFKLELVLKRETSDKKSKGLWAINPLIDFYLKKTNNSLFNTKYDRLIKKFDDET